MRIKAKRLIVGGERLVMALKFVERVAARLPGFGKIRALMQAPAPRPIMPHRSVQR
jgi:hypothetical protein